VNRNFSQTITFRCADPDALVELARLWDEMHATADVMGYIGTRILHDRDDPGRYVIVADFAVVDPEVSAYEEAMRNNERPETQEWARRLVELAGGEPEFRNYDELYRTDFLGRW
jgi:hypothetical protein